MEEAGLTEREDIKEYIEDHRVRSLHYVRGWGKALEKDDISRIKEIFSVVEANSRLDDKNGKKKNVVNSIVEDVAAAYTLLTDTSVTITPEERKEAYEANIERTEKLAAKLKAEKSLENSSMSMSA